MNLELYTASTSHKHYNWLTESYSEQSVSFTDFHLLHIKSRCWCALL